MFMRKSVVKHDISLEIDCPGVCMANIKDEELFKKAFEVLQNSP